MNQHTQHPDGHAWAGVLAFTSHGARIGIRVTEPAVLDRLRGILPVGSAIQQIGLVDVLYSIYASLGSEAIPRYNVYEVLRTVASQCSIERTLLLLESDLQFQVAQYARTALFVHAGVVGWNGRALLIPGRSMSGKTSLVAALVRAGAVYYSDEYAVIHADGSIHPYARALVVRDSNRRTRKVTPEELGAERGSLPLRATAIISTKYSAGAQWRPRRMTNGQAMLALVDNTVVAQTKPKLTVDTLAKAACGVIGLRSPRGEADPVAAWLLRWLDRTRAPQSATDNVVAIA